MLQIDHIYEFLYQELFREFEFCYLSNGVPATDLNNICIFTRKQLPDVKIFFYDQEPVIPQLVDPYVNKLLRIETDTRPSILVTSELSDVVDSYTDLHQLYYFFHAFAAIDWYRGYYALNFNKPVIRQYKKDFITFNRIINNDRSYRIYFVSLLKEYNLLPHGLVSFGVTDDSDDTWHDEVADPNSKLSVNAKLHAEQHLVDISKLIIDHSYVHGSASANIPRTIDRLDYNNDTLNVDAFWHVVTETVFYYDKLHLTEKIFKPIVSKQPFMLLAAPGNLAYLRNYGFKTFSSVIDETYDTMLDADLRIEAVTKQLHWYCNLSELEKNEINRALEPIIQYNFDHFYGEFRHIVAREFIDNTKALFSSLGHDSSKINFDNIYHVLTR